MSNLQETQNKLYQYDKLTRQAGVIRASVFIIFFSFMPIITGISEWHATGDPTMLLYILYLFIEPSRLIEILLILVRYGPFFLIGIVAFGFLLTTHPSIEIGQKGIRVHTFFRISSWLSPENIYLVTNPSSRRPELLLIGIHGLGWPFLVNGLWYLRRWQRAIVISRGFLTGIRGYAELHDFFRQQADS